jgi:hypothetical protein
MHSAYLFKLIWEKPEVKQLEISITANLCEKPFASGQDGTIENCSS